MKSARGVLRCIAPWLLLALPLGAVAAPVFTFASYPLFLAPAIKPNVMVIFDNSESMDATMAGKVISGDDPTTRGNIARSVVRSLLLTYRDSFNWGLTTFETTGNTLYNTHAYYVGDATSMVYTNDCVAGISASNGNRRCIANPDAAVKEAERILVNGNAGHEVGHTMRRGLVAIGRGAITAETLGVPTARNTAAASATPRARSVSSRRPR